MTNDKNKKQPITTNGVQFSNYSNTATNNIPLNSNDVNTNSRNNIENTEKRSFNLSKKDSIGRELSEKQQKY